MNTLKAWKRTAKRWVLPIYHRIRGPWHKSHPLYDQQIRYLLNEVSELRSLIRYLLPDSENFQRFIEETTSSFDYQWKNLDTGVYLLSDPSFKQQAVATMERYTGLSADWFKGKRVLDAGCGNGRWSWVLASLGADVVAIDQSSHGVAATRKACQDFTTVRVEQYDLLEDLSDLGLFDLVWSFGVVHHTGNTWLAIQRIAALVKPGGLLFMMIYGEPRFDAITDFEEVNSYQDLRQQLKLLDFDERVAYLRQQKSEQAVHGWFDAASPRINDLHRFDEIVEWLRLLGYSHIRQTTPDRNIYVMAERVSS